MLDNVVVTIGTGAGSLLLGYLLGWLNHRRRYAIVLPPVSGTVGQYEVRLNGRTVYAGFDLAEAKRRYKGTFPLRAGTVELYSNGNHVASRPA